METRREAEQLAFEEWFIKERGYAEFDKDEDGQYSNRLTHWAWEAWKASRSKQAVQNARQRAAWSQVLVALLTVPAGLVAALPDML
ncbi:hypothetical protein [Noviherbaspirillum sp. ST9]|uniref:hypothetical protein n=1 Tax=Noviherbaspirillum sp. ST9 TaxID=3401606 RepID=UPI003B5863FA